MLERKLADDHAMAVQHVTMRAFIADRRLWSMAAIYFCVVLGQYGLTFWLPTIVRRTGVADPLWVGILTAIPYACAMIAMPILGASGDKRRERRLHLAIPMLISASAFATLPWLGGVAASIVCVSVAAVGILASSSLFWAIPTAVLGGMSAAAGIAAVNCVANLAGFVSPAVVGWLNDFTGKSTAGLILISAAVMLGAALVFRIPAKAVNR